MKQCDSYKDTMYSELWVHDGRQFNSGDHLRRLHKGSGISLKPLQMSSYGEKTKLKDKEERYSMQVVQLNV